MSKKWKIIIGVVAALAVIFFGWLVFGSNRNKTLPRTTAAERKTVTQDVSFTGHLEAEQSASLGFESPGTLTSIGVDVGDSVKAGQRLASLDTRIAQLDLAKAQATKDSTVTQAQQTWQNAQQAYSDTVASNNRTLDQQRQTVRDAKAALDQQQATFQRVSKESGDQSSTTQTAHGLLITTQTAYHAAQQALDSAIKAADKTNTAAAGAATLAHDQYVATLQAAPNNTGVSVLEAGAQAAAISLAKNTLVAPFDGVITTRNGNAHEYVSPNTVVLGIATVDQLKITADVAETDAMKLAVGQKADITFDAFPAIKSWSAEITKIAPAAVLIQGVPTYAVTLSVDSREIKLKPGLTANVTVHASHRDNVIAIPRRAVITRGTQQVVRILGSDGKTAEVPVTTGLVGSDGLIEVTSGLSGGEKVVIDTTTN